MRGLRCADVELLPVLLVRAMSQFTADECFSHDGGAARPGESLAARRSTASVRSRPAVSPSLLNKKLPPVRQETEGGKKDDMTVPLAEIVAEDRLGLLRGKHLAEKIQQGEVNAGDFRFGDDGLDAKKYTCALCGIGFLHRAVGLGWWSPLDGVFAVAHRHCWRLALETGDVPNDEDVASGWRAE